MQQPVNQAAIAPASAPPPTPAPAFARLRWVADDSDLEISLVQYNERGNVYVMARGAAANAAYDMVALPAAFLPHLVAAAQVLCDANDLGGEVAGARTALGAKIIQERL